MYSPILFFIVILLESISLSAIDDKTQSMLLAIQSSNQNWGFSKHREVKKLLDAGVNPNALVNGTTALYLACAKGEEQIAKLLLERGADPLVEDGCGMTPLWRAVVGGHRAICNLLLAKNVPLHVEHKDKSTLLHMAAGAGANPNLAIVQKILEAKATNPNVQDKDGRTPLMFAVSTNLTLVTTLLAAGANVNVEDDFQRTALDYAKKSSALEKEKIVAKLCLIVQNKLIIS